MRKLIEKINTPEFFSGWVMDQSEAICATNNTNKYCFGTRLSIIFCKNYHKKHYFDSDWRCGEAWFYDQAEELNYTEEQVRYSFFLAGASPYPFSTEKWRLPCKKVLNNLLAMEKPPSIDASKNFIISLYKEG